MSFPYKYKPPFNPDENLNQAELREYLNKLKEMEQWLHAQKWDHWGYAHGVFMFAFEEDYTFFLLRWQ
jgi:hypothetical protein